VQFRGTADLTAFGQLPPRIADPLTEMIAKKIIKIAQTGIKDPVQISAQAIKEPEVR
jgi:hypothetical protein